MCGSIRVNAQGLSRGKEAFCRTPYINRHLQTYTCGQPKTPGSVQGVTGHHVVMQ